MSFDILPNEIICEIVSHIDDPFACKDFLRLSRRTYGLCNGSFNPRFRPFIRAINGPLNCKDIHTITHGAYPSYKVPLNTRYRLFIEAGSVIEHAAEMRWTRLVRKYLPPLEPFYQSFGIIKYDREGNRQHVISLFGGKFAGGSKWDGELKIVRSSGYERHNMGY
ncbi:Protein of unknown function [Pyronema omphalodes CBS 100304]|uniref:F-box domain-containing protein n=1 Tax=Pyronema omphalodes (strain CBS 100304) TaxID=1076935 RepID=U4LIG1_PYROM|nr:Protein of unknown function [Pyronema omphalodes CBS 100304]